MVRGVIGSEIIVRDVVVKWCKGWILLVIIVVRFFLVFWVSCWLMFWRIIRGEENYVF